MAITEGTVIAVNGADGNSSTYTSTSFDSSGGGAILYFVVHEGASTTYTWSDNKSTASGNFLALGSAEYTGSGTGANDYGVAAVVVWSPTVGTGHTITCTFNSGARPYRYGGGVVLNGTFGSSSILAATTQVAQPAGNATTVDAGSLVTDAAAYLWHCAGNYIGSAMNAEGLGWTIKSNATGGRHFQIRNESSSGTFDPSFDLNNNTSWVTIAAAIKETAGGGGTTRGTPFGMRGNAFNGGRTFNGILR
jgi:hypothetical protein